MWFSYQITDTATFQELSSSQWIFCMARRRILPKILGCRGGQSYLQNCPEGVIFDTKVDACVTPDQAKREECLAENFLQYNCPKYSAEEPLRFGNHDRLPDPD